MMKGLIVVLLACIVAVQAHYEQSPAELAHHIQQVHAALASLEPLAQIKHDEFPDFPRVQDISTACNTSLTAVRTSWLSATCVTLRATLSVDGSSVPSSSLQAWCESSCKTDLASALGAVTTSCSASADRDFLSLTAYATLALYFKQALFFTNGICVQSSTTYCWTKLVNLKTIAALNPLTNQIATGLTLATVSDFCTDSCAPLLFNVINQWGTPGILAQAKLWQLVCLKVDTSYCFYEISNYEANLVSFQAGLSAAAQQGTTPDFSILCKPCYVAFIRAYAEVQLSIINSFADILGVQATAAARLSLIAFELGINVMKQYCQTAPDGTYCLAKLFAVGSLAQSAQTSCADQNATCSASCASALTSLKTAIGCCATSAALMNLDADDPVVFVTQRCGITLGTCSASRIIASFRIKNFLIAYYNAHKAAIDAAIKADLAAKLKVGTDTIEITGVVDSTTSGHGFVVQDAGATVSFTVTPESTSEATSINSNLQSILTSDSSLPLTTQAASGGASDPNQSISADASTTTTTTQATGASSGTGAGFATAAPTAIIGLITVAVAALGL